MIQPSVIKIQVGSAADDIALPTTSANSANLTSLFTSNYSVDPSNGGKMIQRNEMNALIKLCAHPAAYATNGGLYKYATGVQYNQMATIILDNESMAVYAKRSTAQNPNTQPLPSDDWGIAYGNAAPTTTNPYFSAVFTAYSKI